MSTNAATHAWLSAETTGRIAATLPDEVQRNAIAHMLQLQGKQIAAILNHISLTPNAGLDAADIETRTQIEALWGWAQAMRAKQAEVAALIEAGNAPDRGAIDWPAPPTL